MSMLNLQTGKLRKWKDFGRFHKISLHSSNEIKEEQKIKLYNKLADQVKQQFNESQIMSLLSLGPKKLYKMKYLNTNGWRRGYTK